uniref:Uncharacterized protein n=1 Tax=Timema shepardi TaxID=629360 RepID=A0A7R9AR29_TIMSH|nr:unnamed protein product [Timema shepardi]
MDPTSYYPFGLYALSTNYANGLGIGKVELEEVNPHLRGWRVENHLGKTTPAHPAKIRTSISPFSVVELNTTSALANYATEPSQTSKKRIHNLPQSNECARPIDTERTRVIGFADRLSRSRSPTCIAGAYFRFQHSLPQPNPLRYPSPPILHPLTGPISLELYRSTSSHN